MREGAKQIINNDLENLEKKIALIGFSDPEKHKEFLNRLTALQEQLLGISENELERIKATVITEISKLQSDFDTYMNGTSYPVINEFIPGKKIESGKAKLKAYKIGLYAGIIDDLKKLDIINPNDIEALRDKWVEDSQDKYLCFSPFEISAMEEKISDIFLEYQIKYIRVKGELPIDEIRDFTSNEEYKNRIKERLVEASQKEGISAQTKMEIDDLYQENDLAKLLKTRSLWEILSLRQVVVKPETINAMLGIKPERAEIVPEPKKEEITDLVVLKRKISPQDMVCTIKKTNRFFNKGKVTYKQVVVKVRNGIAKIPERYKKNLIEVDIPEGVVEIADRGFWDCKELRKAHLPSTLKVIGEEAFRNCYQMEEMNLPEGIEIFKDRALYYCRALKNPKLPTSTREIGEESFYSVPFKSLKFSDKLEKIGDRSFALCDDLESIEFEGHLDILHRQVFSNCRKLKNIIFPKNLLEIKQDAFANCKELTDISNIPDTVRLIEDYAFSGCNKIRKINIPAALKRIGRMVFNDKVKLEEILMPYSCENPHVISGMQVNPNITLTFPEILTGETYKSLGIEEPQVLTLKEFRKKVKEAEERKRDEYLETYYGNDAHKYKNDKNLDDLQDNPEVE